MGSLTPARDQIGVASRPPDAALDVLAAMNGKPKAQQKQLLQQMRLNNRLMFK